MGFNITDRDIHDYITSLGFKPACPTLCIEMMRSEYNSGKRIFDFYVNPHNLCWYADDSWQRVNPNENLFKVSLRDFKLNDVLN